MFIVALLNVFVVGIYELFVVEEEEIGKLKEDMAEGGGTDAVVVPGVFVVIKSNIEVPLLLPVTGTPDEVVMEGDE